MQLIRFVEYWFILNFKEPRETRTHKRNWHYNIFLSFIDRTRKYNWSTIQNIGFNRNAEITLQTKQLNIVRERESHIKCTQLFGAIDRIFLDAFHFHWLPKLLASKKFLDTSLNYKTLLKFRSQPWIFWRSIVNSAISAVWIITVQSQLESSCELRCVLHMKLVAQNSTIVGTHRFIEASLALTNNCKSLRNFDHGISMELLIKYSSSVRTGFSVKRSLQLLYPFYIHSDIF